MINHDRQLFCFGLGFSAQALVARLTPLGWSVAATARNAEKAQALAAAGVEVHRFDRDRPLDDARAALAQVTAVLSSVPPDHHGDPVLDQHADALEQASALGWIGYLSTTGVYGDTGGVQVDEDAPLRPTVERSRRRAAAERRWLDLYVRHGLPVHVFRLAGIYGIGRNTLEQVRRGEARRVLRPGHVFSRIHVDDIAQVLEASMARPCPGRVYNVCDDEAAEPADVVAYACGLLGREPPAPVTFAEAEPMMSPMARSFWEDNRRIDNGRIKRELGVVLRYPTYREGLTAIAAQMQDQAPTGSHGGGER